MRLKAVEDAVRGKPADAATGEMAGKLAVQGAVPLQFNAYKIPLDEKSGEARDRACDSRERQRLH